MISTLHIMMWWIFLPTLMDDEKTVDDNSMDTTLDKLLWEKWGRCLPPPLTGSGSPSISVETQPSLGQNKNAKSSSTPRKGNCKSWNFTAIRVHRVFSLQGCQSEMNKRLAIFCVTRLRGSIMTRYGRPHHQRTPPHPWPTASFVFVPVSANCSNSWDTVQRQ